MADDRIELPTRDNKLSVHEEPNVASKRDESTRVDLTTPKPEAPEPPVSPEPKPEAKEEPKEEPKDAEAPNEDLETLRKKRKELEEDNFRYRDRLRREREEKEELKSRVERLESNSKGETDDDYKRVQSELGIDEEAAKKLTRAFKEINKPRQENQPVDKVQKAAKEFSELAYEAMEDFPDWETHREKMTELLKSDIEKNGELKALKRGPLYYYSESRRLNQGDPESAKAQGKKEMAEKVNQKNLATSESSRNSQGRPAVTPKWTKDQVDKLIRDNPEEYQKKRAEIFRDLSGQ